MPAGTGLGYIVIGVVIGIIAGWLLNELSRLGEGKRSQASQLKEKADTIEDLEEEVERLRKEVRDARRVDGHFGERSYARIHVPHVTQKSKRRKDTL